MKHLLMLGGGALLGITALVLLSAFIWLRSTLPDYSKTLTSDTLTAPVTIVRDENGVPHITAENFDDAAFGLGYAQAQDRLWQMDVFRRAAYGRTAEVLGAPFAYDDMRSRAVYKTPQILEKTHNRLDPDIRRTFEAFAAGVNLAIENGEGLSSPEWAALGVTPPPWTAADVSVFAAVGLQLGELSDGFRELRLDRRERVFSAAELELLHTPPPVDFPTLYADTGRHPDATQKSGASPTENTPTNALSTDDTEKSGSGTNFFVVGPSMTATKKPILAVDPHLPLYAPSVVYPVVINLPDDVIAGGAWVGTPAVTFGHNSKIAWGMTHLYADVEDFTIERVDPADPTRYLTPDGPRPFETREVSIPLKGGATRTFTVRETRNGTVISDPGLYPEDGRPAAFDDIEAAYGAGYVVARRQVNSEIGILNIQSIVKMSRARDWDEFRAAVKDFEGTNNMVYADVDGNIGVQMAARLPDRERTNGWNGRRPARGWLGEGRWRGLVPYEELAFVYNPPKGWIADSNSRAVDASFPHKLTETYSPAWRVRRAYGLIQQGHAHTLKSMAAIQTDAFSGQAAWLVPRLMLVELKAPKAIAARDMLAAWDFQMDRDAAAPLLYSAIELALQERLVNGRDKSVAARNADVLLLARILDQNHLWCDQPDTNMQETCAETVEAAILHAVDRLSAAYGADMQQWKWGDAHKAVFPAYFSWAHAPPLDRFTTTTVPTSGGQGTLNVGSAPRPQAPTDDLLAGLDFRQMMGASYRMVVDMSDLENSRFMSVPGVSGNALSPYWSDQAGPWAAGAYFQLMGREVSGKHATTIAPAAR